MTGIQGGIAWPLYLDEKQKSKKHLGEMVRADPRGVIFYATSPLGPQFDGPVAELDPLDILYVVGPDPENKRTWYAQIKWIGRQLRVT